MRNKYLQNMFVQIFSLSFRGHFQGSFSSFSRSSKLLEKNKTKKSGLLTNQTRTTPTFISHFTVEYEAFVAKSLIFTLLRKILEIYYHHGCKLFRFMKNSLQTVREGKVPFPWIRSNFQVYSRTQTSFHFPVKNQQVF